MMSLHKSVEKMSHTMDKIGLTELEAENSFVFGLFRRHIHLSKMTTNMVPMQPVSNYKQEHHVAHATLTTASAPVAATPVAPTPSKPAIKSPMVGVAYLSPEPGAKPFIEIGASVKSGDTICLIEAMKTFNPVKADKDGKITQILIKDGDAVEFDTALVIIE